MRAVKQSLRHTIQHSILYMYATNTIYTNNTHTHSPSPAYTQYTLTKIYFYYINMYRNKTSLSPLINK